jgi:hypothetical protein
VAIDNAAGVITNAVGIAGGFTAAPIVSAAISQVNGLGGMPTTTLSPGIGSFGSANAAFGTANTLGSPGIVQAASATAAGPINPGAFSPALTSGGISGLTTTYPGGSSVTPGGVSNVPLSTTLGAGGTAGGYQTYFSSLGQQQYQMLNLQIAMQQEYQFFATLSNVLKTRHDTVKAAISNIR